VKEFSIYLGRIVPLKRHELSPESKEILRKWLERAEAERRRKFPQFYEDTG
jgi:hypothetical protein